MLNRIYSEDEQRLNLPAKLPVRLEVFGSDAEFTQHFLDESYAASVSSTYGSDAEAVTEGPQSMAINVESLSLDGAINVLAHEFTHALIATSFSDVPTWVNEGLAWHDGLAAELGDSSLSLLQQSLLWNLWSSPVEAAREGLLQPLLTASSVATTYNVEAQDNYAVEQLIQADGVSGVEKFLREIPSMGEAKAFQSVFGESESTFATKVNQALKAYASAPPISLQVKIKVLPGASSELFVSNPQGVTYVFTGATVGNTYTFNVGVGGSVQTPSGLTLTATVQSQSDGHWDIGSQIYPDQAFFSFKDDYGLGYLVTLDAFVGDSVTATPLLSNVTPLGLELVSLKTGSVQGG